MRKRLRKKHRVGEFQENVFGVRVCLRESLVPEDDEFLWRFLEGAIEANGLACGGGGEGSSLEFYVQLPRRGSPTEEQRAAVGEWLARQPEVSAYLVGEFFDGWHGSEEAPYTRCKHRVP